MVEQGAVNSKVGGSIPSNRANLILYLMHKVCNRPVKTYEFGSIPKNTAKYTCVTQRLEYLLHSGGNSGSNPLISAHIFLKVIIIDKLGI